MSFFKVSLRNYNLWEANSFVIFLESLIFFFFFFFWKFVIIMWIMPNVSCVVLCLWDNYLSPTRPQLLVSCSPKPAFMLAWYHVFVFEYGSTYITRPILTFLSKIKNNYLVTYGNKFSYLQQQLRQHLVTYSNNFGYL